MRHRVLVVDDDPDTCSILSAWLTRAGYQTAMAVTGASALEIADAWMPDALLLDIVMPGLTGIDVLRELRASHRLRGIAVVVVTAGVFSSHDDVIAAGADDCLVKPVPAATLLIALQAAIAHRQRWAGN